jgi:hypothetical protein
MSKFINTGAGLTGILLFVLFMVIIGPLLGIWALNTLFSLNIEYSFLNWVAMVILTGTIRSTHKSEK